MGFVEKKNIYVCEACAGHIVTVDLVEGVTPFMVGCHCKPGCKGMMKSSMYRVFDQCIGASHEWYQPGLAERRTLTAGVLSHVNMGGLLLRRAGDRREPSGVKALENWDIWLARAESLLDCYRSGQISERQWQAHIAAGEVPDLAKVRAA